VTEMGKDIQLGLVDEACRAVFRREAADPTPLIEGTCFLCGDKFGPQAPRNRHDPTVCDWCNRDKKRDDRSFIIKRR